MSFVHSQQRFFPSHWQVISFDEAFEDLTGGNAKVQTRDYQRYGILPVIDQGQRAVAGYVNDAALACRAPLPCILFGDHTRIFKYASRPFALGADGVKVLAPRLGLDARFAFHYLQTVRLPEDLGYSRHFKHLREAVVPRPPQPEQRRIADILDKADAIRRKRKEVIALTEELLRSAFLEMFGDPVTNPKGWPVKPLGLLGELDRGRSRHRPRNDPALLDGPYPLIQTGEVANCDGVITAYEQTYSDLGLAQSKMWPAGTLCITIAANIAKTGILAFDACFPDSVVGFTPNADATIEYVQYWLGFLQPILERQAPQVAQKNINLEILRTLDAPTPPVELQRAFSRVVARIRQGRAGMRSAAASADRLYSSLVNRAFSRASEPSEAPC